MKHASRREQPNARQVPTHSPGGGAGRRGGRGGGGGLGLAERLLDKRLVHEEFFQLVLKGL
jgi:hypothetical protein